MSDPAEGGTKENDSASLSNDDPVMDEHLQPDHRSEAGPAVEQGDPAQVHVDRLAEDEDAANPRGESLFTAQDEVKLRRQWNAAQTAFVDDPRAAVERADHLVNNASSTTWGSPFNRTSIRI